MDSVKSNHNSSYAKTSNPVVGGKAPGAKCAPRVNNMCASFEQQLPKSAPYTALQLAAHACLLAGRQGLRYTREFFTFLAVTSNSAAYKILEGVHVHAKNAKRMCMSQVAMHLNVASHKMDASCAHTHVQ